MRVFVNELALGEACAASSPPHAALEKLLLLRQRSALVREVLYCAGDIGRTQVKPGLDIAAVASRMPRDRRSLLLNWVNRMGPFIESDKQVVDDDLFHFEDIEVTDLGLGEAARRILAARPAAVCSVIEDSATSRFAASPLRVLQGFLTEPLTHLDVPNFRARCELEAALQGKPADPKTWSELLEHCRNRYDRLLIGEHCDATLRPRPYTPSVGNSIIGLLDILQRMMVEMAENGSLTPEGRELLQQHFRGRRALFSGESRTRRQADPGRFIFPDPSGDGELECMWHGKISTQFYRLHFEWPVPPPSRYLKVCYIGPHL